MDIDPKDFEEIKIKGEIFYKTLSGVYCPFFNEKLYFNSQGLQHLKFKQRGVVRMEQDQYMRFKLLHLAPEILRVSHTVQGKFQTQKFEQVRIHSRTDTVLRFVVYYEFIALVKRDRVKIIVKQIGTGEKFFWSIIPFWRMDKKTNSRVFHEGFPEED
jgi:hypothetical protein